MTPLEENTMDMDIKQTIREQWLKLDHLRSYL
jgi:hypothetical protein